jgi:hypothetical protein
MHYTLDPLNPESISLIRDMIQEVRPLFRTRFFNICCDETFDLGKGRNAEKAKKHGTGRLYVDFLKKIMAVVLEAGGTPMFWGDIIGHHPELISEIPREAIALDWDYEPELLQSNSSKLRKAKIPFIVCPGVWGFNNSWLNDLNKAHQNILNFAKKGLDEGALGLLNTDWGDTGHINFLGNSYHGFVLGAAAAWNPSAAENQVKTFDRAFSTHEWNDSSAKIVKILRLGAELTAPFGVWWYLEFWRKTSRDFKDDHYYKSSGVAKVVIEWDGAKLLKNFDAMGKLLPKLESAIATCCPRDPLLSRETIVSFRIARIFLGVTLAVKRHAGQVPGFRLSSCQIADEIRHVEIELSDLWHLRNRPSEYYRIRTVLMDIAERLDAMEVGGRKRRSKL